MVFVLHPGALGSSQNDVKGVAGVPLVAGDRVVIGCHQTVTSLLIGDALIDRIQSKERIAWEIHLRDHPLREIGTEQREVNVRWTPGIMVVLPRVRGRLN